MTNAARLYYTYGFILIKTYILPNLYCVCVCVCVYWLPLSNCLPIFFLGGGGYLKPLNYFLMHMYIIIIIIYMHMHYEIIKLLQMLKKRILTKAASSSFEMCFCNILIIVICL